MQPLPLVTVKLLQPFTSLLREIGIPVNSVLRRAQLPTLLDEHSDAFVSAHLAYAFREEAAARSGLDDLGWRAGARVWRQDALSSPLLRKLGQSLTLKHALDILGREAARESSATTIWLVPQGEEVWVCWQRSVDDTRTTSTQSLLFMFGIMLSFVQHWVGPQWSPTQLALTTTPMPALMHREPFSTTRVAVGQPAEGFSLPRTFLALPSPRTRLGSAGALSSSPAASPAACPADDFVGALRQALTPYLGDGHPSIELAAAIAGGSVRTLQRHLARSRLSYTELVAQVRYEVAVRALHDPAVKLIDLAYDLGYTDPTSFTRAFQRWAGVSPRTYRRQLATV